MDEDDFGSKQAIIEFVCLHELFEAFHVLLSEPNIEQYLTTQPLFVLFHLTKLKYFIHQHSLHPNNNVLSINLDAMLQSLCYLIRKFQPHHIAFQEGNNENMEATDVSYSSLFYSLHQRLKVHAILSCNKSQSFKTNLINNNFKLNPDKFDFRHLDIREDIAKNQEIEFELIEIIRMLGCINNKKIKKNEEKINDFLQFHSFETFESELFDFLNERRLNFQIDCMQDIIYKIAQRMTLKSKQQNEKYSNMEQQTYLSKMQYFTKPNSQKHTKPNENNNKNNQISDLVNLQKQSDGKYKIGMKVQCKVKNEWKNGKIISMRRGKIKCSIDGLSVHVNIGNLSHIKLIKNNDRMQLRPRQKNINYAEAGKSIKYERGRRFWNDEEDKALKAGMIRYKNILHIKSKGVKGIWSKIKADDEKSKEPKLKHRTSKMLYDRYRTYVKNNMVPSECMQNE